MFNKKKQTENEELKKLKTTIDKIFADTKDVREKMTRYKKRFEGEWYNKSLLTEQDSKIYANLFFSTVMTIAPLLTDNRPIWSVRARKVYMQRPIESYSLRLEYLWDKLEMDMKLLPWVLDALIMKIGVIQVSFDPDTDDIRIDVVDPRNYFIAPGYTDNWDAPMQGMRERKPLSWVRERYPDNGAEVKAENDLGETEDTKEEEGFELHSEYTTVYTVWFRDSSTEKYFVDKHGNEVDNAKESENTKERKQYPNGRIKVFAGKTLLEDKPYKYNHSKPPYVTLYDYINPHEFYGLGEADQIEEMNISFNRTLQLMDKWTQYYCDPPWFLESNSGLEFEKVKDTLLAGGGLFSYNAMNTEGKDGPLHKAPAPDFPQPLKEYISMLLKLFEEITRVTDVAKGMTTKQQRVSATEISTLAESSYTGTRQRVRNLEFSIKRTLYLMIEIMQQYYTEPRGFSLRRDQNIEWYNTGNTKEVAEDAIRAPMRGNPSDETATQVEEDYQKFLEEIGGDDEVYAEFDLEIQTNSTLPMDRQSLANLFLRLLEMASVSPSIALPMWEATLERLQVPKHKEIIAEMKKMLQQEQQGPQQPPPMAGPPSPLEAIRG